MWRYQILNAIGDGTAASVCKAVHRQSGELVAIKRFKHKFYHFEECQMLRELQMLRRLCAHPNIVRLKEAVREDNRLFLVFEYLDSTLHSVIRQQKQPLCQRQATCAAEERSSL